MDLEQVKQWARRNKYGFRHCEDRVQARPIEVAVIGEMPNNAEHAAAQLELIYALEPRILVHELYTDSPIGDLERTTTARLKGWREAYFRAFRQKHGLEQTLELRTGKLPTGPLEKAAYKAAGELRNAMTTENPTVIEEAIAQPLRQLFLGQAIRSAYAERIPVVAIVHHMHLHPTSLLYETFGHRSTATDPLPLGYIVVNQEPALEEELARQAKFFRRR
ncbi:hypothetical protein HY489_01580 [Candidatus Woesearchaeota archaeon]|nr:hypothetical protein [Candidatus Woesearchaeota archaeon]